MTPKIPANRVQSDECSINIGRVVEDGEITDEGVSHFVHKGEWVEVLPVATVREVMQLSKLQQGTNIDGQLGENLGRLCDELSRRIIAWNWTDLMGQPMEQPFNRPDVLEGLSSDELLWLVGITSGGELADDRKKDSQNLDDISLVTADSPST